MTLILPAAKLQSNGNDKSSPISVIYSFLLCLKKKFEEMRVTGLLALGGAMALNFEELSYNKLKGAFSKVSLTTWSSRSSLHNGPVRGPDSGIFGTF